MSEPSVRPARATDLEQILAIEQDWSTTPHWNKVQFEKELAGPRAYFVVLERDGEVLGYAGIWVIPPEAQITTIAVKPQAARQGHGRTLLTNLLEESRARGCDKVTLEASAKNTSALQLYESEGFRVVGRRPKFYNDGSDAVLMDL
ncbi:MAG: ribosomal-protein-alanine N-acetyltransferase [Elusimicrobia bacterium RIFCSPHIGHO2_02_FULL_57_9]|nr:MAG: ribosomal-protein-alanine N-acetyltransferase [Elusimicrobia bacterium RIFCSPHIGHO2_02_FULL_57_9]